MPPRTPRVASAWFRPQPGSRCHDRRVTDEPKDESPAAPAPDAGSRRATQPIDPRLAQRYSDIQRTFASRLFPGPSKQMSNELSEHIEGLLKPLDEDATKAWLERRANRKGGTRAADDSPARKRAEVEGSGSGRAASASSAAATVDDIAHLRETLDEQNELLRAILASSVDTQTDARSTAQNSRTFAWAGTAIALLTLIATVLSIIAATGH